MAQRAPEVERRSGAWPLLVLALVGTAVSQAWTLGLSFQLDDYALLWRPLELFRLATEHSTDEVPSFALRWTSWSLWALLDAVLPTPRAELPYHHVGLGLHLTCTWAVFSIARRLAPHAWDRLAEPSARDTAAALAALWFGVQAGGAQAHSWISAWGGLTAALCSLLALRAWLSARDADRDGALASRLPLALWTLAALLSKTPALALPPALAWLALWVVPSGLPSDPRGRARRAREWAAIAAALAAGLAIRAAYLGNARPRYGDRRPLDPTDIPRVLLSGLENLGQGIVATNSDALVADGPRGLFGVHAASVGVGLVLATFGLWWLAAPSRWRTLLGLFGALIAVGGPAGAIWGGRPINVMARTTYLPLALASLVVGLGLAGALRRGGTRMVAALLLMMGLGAVWFTGRADVVWTERLADLERRQHLGALTQAAERVGQGGLIILREAPDGFVGVPQLGSLLHAALNPTFWDGPRPALVRCTNDRQLRSALADGDLRGESVAVLVPRGGDASTPADARAARELVDVWNRTEHWPEAPRADWSRLEREDGVTRLVFDRPMPPFGFAGLAIEAAESGRMAVRYLGPGNELRAALAIDLVPGRPSSLGAPTGLDFRLGGPLTGVELVGPPLEDVLLLFALPAIEVDAPWMSQELELAPEQPLPPISIRRPAGWALPPIARLTMRVQRTVGETEVYADCLLGADGTAPEPFLLDQVHIEPDARPGDPEVFRASWPEAVTRLAELITNAEGAPSGEVTWSMELLHPDGTPAAAARPLEGRYRLRE